MPEKPARIHVLVSGLVQGVGYRASVVVAARARGLRGWVRNLRDGRVELWAEGPAQDLAALLAACRRGPPAARVDDLQQRAADAHLLDLRRPGERFSVLPTS